VYVRVIDENGLFLHAYKYRSELTELLWEIIGLDPALQLLCTRSRSFPPIANEFLAYAQVIPFYKPDSTKFSYMDGVFDSRQLEFVPHDLCGDDVVCGVHIQAPFPQNCLQPNLKWQELPTPRIDAIFEHQQIPLTCLYWFFFMLGRMLHPEDNLQLFIALIGLPSTGKSLLAKIIQEFFAPGKVGALSARTGNDNFLLSTVYGKEAWVMMEPPAETDFPQEILLAMVAGEPVYVNRKNMHPRYDRAVNGHGVLVANELPRWKREDPIAFMRRVCPFVFRYPVLRIDTMLFQRIKLEEFPVLVIKSARAYIAVKEIMGKRGFWACCPKWFKSNREGFLRSRSQLYRFLTSHMCERGPDFVIEEPMFLDAYRTFLNLPKFGESSKLGTEVGFYSVLAYCGISVEVDYDTGHRTIKGVRCL
jgi:hypothetical protein